MGKSKKVFSENDIKFLAKRFKALSEGSRLKILRSLLEKEKCVTEIIEDTDLLQANVSKQLKMLNDEGIIECRPAGLQRFYKVVDPTIQQICNIVCKAAENNGDKPDDKK